MSLKRKNKSIIQTKKTINKYQAVPGIAVISKSEQPGLPHGTLGSVSGSQIPPEMIRQLKRGNFTRKGLSANGNMMKNMVKATNQLTRKHQSGGDQTVGKIKMKVLDDWLSFLPAILSFNFVKGTVATSNISANNIESTIPKAVATSDISANNISATLDASNNIAITGPKVDATSGSQNPPSKPPRRQKNAL